jgi:DNA-directed RNA polymerase beta' subunit
MNYNLNIYFINYSLNSFTLYINKNKELNVEKQTDLTKNNKDLNYIFLNKPIFNPLYIDKIKNILENICPIHYILYKDNKEKSCSVYNCKNKYKKFKIDTIDKEIIFIDNNKNKFTAKKTLQIFENIDKNTINKLGFLYFKNININTTPCELILNYIPIIPKYIRPSIVINNLETEDILTIYYKKIMNYKNKNDFSNIYETYKDIIIKNKNYNDKYKSITQRIGSKLGIFRNNILGKRTKLCGRSVITPDIYININEIGIPIEMANKLIINNRFIRNNDYVLFIRHPTLQKMSVMSMKVKVQSSTFTIRMNPALCQAYNADFDGDEMNIFCMSNYKSISESIYINSPKNSIISPQDNQPIIYPSQDCLSALYILTYKNIKIKKNIFYNCLCIIKKNIKDYKKIDFNSRSLFSLSLPTNFEFIYKNVKIKNGILVNGYIDKNIILKIIKCMLDKYNKDLILKFIYDIQLIISEWLNYLGLSIGYDDCFIPSIYKQINLKHNKNTLLIINNNNSFNYIIKSGCKGSITNILQIIISVGQQYIKNQKIPTLTFLNNKSFCYNSYSNGLTYYEYFYHCQSAREGIISTNIKTPNIGYTQRKITKFLEDIIIQYDKYVIFNKYLLKV